METVKFKATECPIYVALASQRAFSAAHPSNFFK